MDVKPAASNAASIPMPAGQVVYMIPPQQGQTATGVRPAVRCLSISIIVLGVLTALLGIVAVVLRTIHSYVGNPIWSSLLFFIVTGILGICVYRKKDNNKLRIALLVMSIISSACAGQLIVLTWGPASSEWYGHCYPGKHRYVPCVSPAWTRVVISVLLGFLALAILVLCIVSCSVTIYGLCRCFYECCGGVPTEAPVMVQYDPNSGVVMSPITGMEGYEVTSQHQNTTAVCQNAPSATTPPEVTNDEPEVIETKGLLESELDMNDDNKASGNHQNWETFS